MSDILQPYRRCDFCNTNDEPQHRWVFRSQVIPAGTDIDFMFELMEHPEWLACPTCHSLIQRGDLVGLVAVNKEVDAHPRLKQYFTKLYSSLLQNLTNN